MLEEEKPEEWRVSEKATAFLVTKETEWNWALRFLKEAMGQTKALGLDVERLPKKQQQPDEKADPKIPNDQQRLRNIAWGRDPLLQLAAPGVAVLIRLCFFTTLSKSLIALLADKQILKLGVDILEDASQLRENWRLRVASCLDLRNACCSSQRFMEEFHFNSFNLKSIGAFFHEDINEKRKWNVTCSNWAAPRLRKPQILYAAKDALAAVGSYIKLVQGFFDVSFADVTTTIWSHVHTKMMTPYINRPYVDHKWNGNPDHLNDKQYWRLWDKKDNSDSELEFDFDKERERELKDMEQPAVVWFQRPGVSREERVGGMGGVLGVEKELLDWCIDGEVPEVIMTVDDKEAGKRYRLKLKIDKRVQA